MSEPCQVEGCKLKARWKDATRPRWDCILPPNVEDSTMLQDWKRENGYIEIYWENHCDIHHREFVVRNSEHAISRCVDEDLQAIIDSNGIRVPRCSRINIPYDIWGEDESDVPIG